MDVGTCESALRRDGYLDVEERSTPGGTAVGVHRHEFDIRALVLAGSITIDFGTHRRTWEAGEILEVPAGADHSEQFGPQPYRAVVGRRHRRPPAAA